MARFEITLPKLGESVMEATLLRWHCQPGDVIAQDDILAEIATDKVDTEVPAPAGGRILELRYPEGAVIPVGQVICVVETDAQAAAVPTPVAPEPEAEAVAIPYVPTRTEVTEDEGEGRFYSPLVLNIARKEGISITQLEAMQGTGHGGRVTKKDILDFVARKNTAPAAEPPKAEPAAPAPEKTVAQQPIVSKPSAPAIQFTHSGSYEIQEMDRMRKLIARNMVHSKQTSAHVTSFVEADVTQLVMWRNRKKEEFMRKYKESLTFTPVFVQAIVKALREFPAVNSSVEGDNILLKRDINIGIAVALPTDNLIVPVIKHADRLNLAGLAATINDLAARARINKLRPDELEGGTYTLSNVGSFGNVMGTPIIMQPQVAIMATGVIRKLPAVVETPTGDVIAIRHKMFLSHSYDHRIIDGALGGKFARRVGDILENWDMDTEV